MARAGPRNWKQYVVSVYLCGILSLQASWIDADTPHSARVTSALSDAKVGVHKLVFSDEFELAGRSFREGSDPKWIAINSYNPTTQDLEAYVADQARTEDGKLIIEVSTDIVVDASGTPRPFSSAMLQTWNRSCFRGGILEVSLKLPGRHDRPGLWPAVWMMGNLGRVGFGSGLPGDADPESLDGIWPFSYNACEEALHPGAFPANAKQKYDACPGRPAYCLAQNYTIGQCDKVARNKAMLGHRGRGATEMDLIEVAVNPEGGIYKAEVSTSLQIAPSTGDNGWYEKKGRCYEQVRSNMSTGDITHVNEYHGAWGTEVLSGLTEIGAENYEEQVIYRMEWLLDNRIAWYMKRPSDSDFVYLFQVDQAALEACGAKGTSNRTEKRPIPEEPSYLLLNVAVGNTFSPVPVFNDTFWDSFPYRMEVDYVRFYQDEGGDSSLACDTAEFPSAEFIQNNPSMYQEPSISDFSIGCKASTCNATGVVNNSDGAKWYSFVDTRCLGYGQIPLDLGPGCNRLGGLECRQCYPRSSFEDLAMGKNGIYGNGERWSFPKVGMRPFPICPPCVCEEQGLDYSECLQESLPDSSDNFTGCKMLVINNRITRYCSNGAKNRRGGSNPQPLPAASSGSTVLAIVLVTCAVAVSCAGCIMLRRSRRPRRDLEMSLSHISLQETERQ
eukprot:TRINITY_DN64073_c0_g1_i1.p1 TRINITY_DN64073_c0_g1~~TRINITY_DN64073_c0_g1_i1.p1  ORF type:complete len:687 (-),score=95.26 TRINITY_DN64073_c0_g1_i1:135-2147(-)